MSRRAAPAEATLRRPPRVGDDEPVDKLTAAMAAGDPAAVAAFYRRYFPRLYAWARRSSRRDESFCLDVVQDAVLRVVRTVRRADAEPQLLAWLRLVVQTTAYDRLKAERRRGRRQAVAAVTVPPDDEDEDKADAATRARYAIRGGGGRADDDRARDDDDRADDDTAADADDEQLAWLRAELDAMDPRLARMIDLRFRGGWTLARIGAVFGVSAGTVDGRLRRALAALRGRAREAFDDA